MPLIRETILTTVSAEGRLHITPIGIIAGGDGWIIAPFRPSTTLDNLRAVPFAVANHTDDVRIFAGCLTGRQEWPTRASDNVPVPRLVGALAHVELAVVGVTEDEQRPRFQCVVVGRGLHAPFEGFNRAQAAVIEAAILVSRLHMLPREKIEAEIGYLEAAIEKTAGARETEAWVWLMEAVRAHFARNGQSAASNHPLS
ncbi:MAG: DUF447 domain-containing protein [Xanthobacteraceae bacterium]